MPVSQSIREQLLSSFRAELSEHVQVMNDGLLALEQDKLAGKARDESLHEIFRAAHSLKGAARTVGATAIEQLAHKLEGVLDGLRKGTLEASPRLFDACYKALDAVQAVHRAYEAGDTTPPVDALQALLGLETFQPGKDGDHPKAVVPPTTSSPDDKIGAYASSPVSNPTGAVNENGTIRVNVEKLDGLMTHLSELLVIKTRAEERLARAQELQELMTLWQREWFSVHSAYSRALHQDLSGALRRLGPVEKGNGTNNDTRIMGKDILRLLDYLEISQQRLSEATTRINGIVREYDGDTTHMSQVIDELGEEIKRVNMLPLNTITSPFKRMVRDLAEAAKKKVTLQLMGGEIEIDKRVLEQIKDPLIHLLRNAVDHGIEPPEERQAKGKPAEGVITLTAEQSGKDVVIRVSDDGAGLDLEGIRKAIQHHGKTDADTLSEAELVESIFRSGITTSRIITEISGRGVGLDVVRKNVEALHGYVNVEWAPGKGSSFIMALPLRLTSSIGLLVSVSNQTFAIPVNNIDRILTIDPKEVFSLEGRNAIQYNDRPITLVSLGDVLGLENSMNMLRPQISVVVLSLADRCMAFAVEEILGDQEVVVKGLGKQLIRVNCIAGCTIMGNGEIVLILNVYDLIRQSARTGYHPSLNITMPQDGSEGKNKRRILVVDDSITTRTLEKNILEAAGYNVEVAINGEAALEVIRTNGIPDLMIVDIIMPLMNGFDLTQKVKGDPNLAHVPVILVTSLDSPEDKARGIEAGAEAYIVKSAFNQNNLLESIEQLI